MAMSKTTRRALALAGQYGGLMIFAIFTTFPFLWAVSFGLSSDASSAYKFPDGFVPQIYDAATGNYSIGATFEWFGRVFKEMPFLNYLKNSTIMSVMTIIGVVAVSVLAAYPLARMRFPGRGIIFVAIIATMMLPSEVNIIPNFITLKRFGDFAHGMQALIYGGDWMVWTGLLMIVAALVSTVALSFARKRIPAASYALLGLFVVGLLLVLIKTLAFQADVYMEGYVATFWNSAQPAGAFVLGDNPDSWRSIIGLDSYFGAVAPNIATAFGLFLMKQAFEQIPQDLIDAARVDGATEMQILWKVMVPVTAPSIAALAIFTLVNAWNDYLWPSIVLTGKEKLPLAVGVFNDLTGPFATSDNILMAAIVLTVLPVLVFFAFTQRYFIAGMDGAVK